MSGHNLIAQMGFRAAALIGPSRRHFNCAQRFHVSSVREQVQYDSEDAYFRAWQFGSDGYIYILIDSATLGLSQDYVLLKIDPDDLSTVDEFQLPDGQHQDSIFCHDATNGRTYLFDNNAFGSAISVYYYQSDVRQDIFALAAPFDSGAADGSMSAIADNGTMHFGAIIGSDAYIAELNQTTGAIINISSDISTYTSGLTVYDIFSLHNYDTNLWLIGRKDASDNPYWDVFEYSAGSLSIVYSDLEDWGVFSGYDPQLFANSRIALGQDDDRTMFIGANGLFDLASTSAPPLQPTIRLSRVGFNPPGYVAIDADGNLYQIDYKNALSEFNILKSLKIPFNVR